MGKLGSLIQYIGNCLALVSSADRGGLDGNFVQEKLAEEKCALWPIVAIYIERHRYRMTVLAYTFSSEMDMFIIFFNVRIV